MQGAWRHSHERPYCPRRTIEEVQYVLGYDRLCGLRRWNQCRGNQPGSSDRIALELQLRWMRADVQRHQGGAQRSWSCSGQIRHILR